MKTRAFLFLLFPFLFFVGCEKEQLEDPIIIEPPFDLLLLETDSISSGEKLGITIGSKAFEVYQMIRDIREEHRIGGLQLVGNIFSAVADLADRLPLYKQLLFDEQTGTGSGIQLYFEQGKVASIWTNNGDKLSQWPQNPFAKAYIAVNDPVGSVHKRLQTISTTKQYAKKFERLSLFAKDLDKAYDPIMGELNEWYFAIAEEEHHLRIYHFYFDGGKLVAIKTELLGPTSGSEQRISESQNQPNTA